MTDSKKKRPRAPRVPRIPTPKAFYGGGEPALSETQKTVNLAREIIKESGKPVPLGALFREIQHRGVEIPGKNPTNTLGARLSNSSEVLSLSGFGWWLAEEAYPLAGYDPSEATPADDHGGPSAGANPH